MSSSLASPTGTVVLRVDAPTPAVLLLRVVDAAGRTVVRRRVHDRRLVLDLPTGDHRFVVTDGRALHDPRRLAGATVEVAVTGDEAVEVTAALARGAVLRAETARWARVSAVHADGERLESRADGRGAVVLAGLRTGAWTVVAHDPRHGVCSEAAVVELAVGTRSTLDLPATTPTSRLLVDVRGGDRRPVEAAAVTVTDETGRTTTAPVRGGLADLRDLRPGRLRVVVPPSVGHLGTTVDLEVEPGSLGHVTAVSPVGATVSGRVVQAASRRGVQYAAVVALLDEDGIEVERVRTDETGRFVLGRGLRAAHGVTVVATTGPETLHVTRAAVADVCVLNGVRHDLGEIVLPVAGRPAVWTARTPAVAGMKLPSTRV